MWHYFPHKFSASTEHHILLLSISSVTHILRLLCVGTKLYKNPEELKLAVSSLRAVEEFCIHSEPGQRIICAFSRVLKGTTF